MSTTPEQIFKVIIAGSRSFDNYEILRHRMDYYLQHVLKTAIVNILSGGAKGADALGEKYAKERNLPVQRFLADWNTHGKSAGIIRNCEMAKIADAAVVFWDGKSSGSKHMIDEAKRNPLTDTTVRAVNARTPTTN